MKKQIAATMAILLSQMAPVFAQDVPDFMHIVAANEGAAAVPSKQKVAFDNIYALNEGMFPIYERSLATYRQHFRDRQNLIMALFSAKGGRFILYRAGQATPIEAPPPPEVYRLAKAVGHCAMATYDLLAPYTTNATADQSWVGELAAYNVRVKTAENSLDAADLTPENRALLRSSLQQIDAFQTKCLANKNFSFAELETFAHGIKPDLVKLIALASSTQVAHWYKVMEGWKQMLGKDWDNTYALSNSIYVARQNNILYSILVQFFGENAMNDRVLLLETTDFTATPEAMMDAFIRIISDRALGMVFYKNYHLMDYELLGGGGRAAIEAEAAKRGQKAILPPLVPYNSHAWPWKVDPASGSGPASLEDIH